MELTKCAMSDELAKHERAVIPGFYGQMPNGTVRTFSRGGSDITGSIVALFSGSDLYENWTDVSGVLMADPRIVDDPLGIDLLTYRELRELSYMGASVLHEDATFPVRNAGRKWRPGTFDEVCGQEQVTEVLKYEVSRSLLSHAYLFCGSRGTGKTTCAKILAKAVNCDAPVGGNPCLKCPSCLSVASGAATDILEMDAASNNKVDDIRTVLDEVIFTPSSLAAFFGMHMASMKKLVESG